MEKANQLFGYRELAAEVERVRAGRPIFANDRYQDAASWTFYPPDHYEVWALNIISRTNVYDYRPGKPDLSKVQSKWSL